jgi:uncharacterized protein (TIGR04141 family)
MKLVFSLFDDTVDDFEEVFLEGKLSDPKDPYVPVPLRAPNDNIRVYLQRNKMGVPAWITFFEKSCDFRAAFPHLPEPTYRGDFLVNQYNSLVVGFRVNHPNYGKRYLALTQGMGHLAIDHARVEDDFGLTVGMNTIDPTKVRGVDARELGTRTQVKRLRANFEGEVWELDFDPEVEMVGGMEGTPQELDFADQVSGSESVSLFRQITWDQLEEVCRLLLEKYYSHDYKKRFRFAANKRRVKNKKNIAVLDERLREMLRDRQSERLSMVLPIDAADNVVTSELQIPGRGQPLALAPFSVKALFQSLDAASLNEFEPRKLTIQHFDANGTLIKATSLYKHLVCELEISDPRGQIHVLADGRWYEVAKKHIDKVRQRLQSLPVLSLPHLPPLHWSPNPNPGGKYRHEREDEYNSRIAGKFGLALFDKKLFRDKLGGNSRIEVCDLLGSDGRFYCVKKYEGSSDLSHLFGQGMISVELFVDMQEYREFTAERIGSTFTPPFNASSDRHIGLKLVYAIVCPDHFILPNDLPFFAQASLAHHVKRVKRCGFDVELAKIIVPDPPSAGPASRRRRKKAPQS